MNKVKNNPLLTRRDMARAAAQLIEPLIPCLTPGKARVIVGEGSAHYPEDVAGMEGFSRALWALVPMLIGKCPEANTNLIWPRTYLPTLRVQMSPGEHVLLCAVFADTGDAFPENIPQGVMNLARSL